MDNPSPSRTHPMVIVAASAITVASLAATAWFAGYLPPRAEPATTAAPATSAPPPPPTVAVPQTPAAAAPAAVAPAPTTEKKPAPIAKARPQDDRDAPIPPPRQVQRRPANRDPAFGQQGFAAEAPMGDNGWNGRTAERNPPVLQSPAYGQAQPVCRECGIVESVREIRQEGEGSGLGAVGGGVIGGLLGNQIGGGRGKTVGAVVGAVGGALAGNEVERNVRSTRHFEIAVRFDDGNVRTFMEAQAPSLQRGDRVRMVNGQLMRF
ncbi:glycine zipper 2TM domain-containing protein [Propionivibrio dicarboxylicus]|uniref:Glycine zipper 2TM domain-containing protein n=1 Tax=Propionivibrio dicarboxylicus TaxID=83767 RepID=A0A1G8CS45_9RHOO|nr:glycine zipper 2TM domain-containing protein [Propionivibrio dicarboxylicus]SDH48286.1 Glycine zipper 2TM domain-containing protein [Propionivibrio dicarboxylicus]